MSRTIFVRCALIKHYVCYSNIKTPEFNTRHPCRTHICCAFFDMVLRKKHYSEYTGCRNLSHGHCHGR